jgi:hypothetical protein
MRPDFLNLMFLSVPGALVVTHGLGATLEERAVVELPPPARVGGPAPSVQSVFFHPPLIFGAQVSEPERPVQPWTHIPGLTGTSSNQARIVGFEVTDSPLTVSIQLPPSIRAFGQLPGPRVAFASSEPRGQSEEGTSAPFMSLHSPLRAPRVAMASAVPVPSPGRPRTPDEAASSRIESSAHRLVSPRIISSKKG